MINWFTAELHREINEITYDIIGAAMKVHSELGPGLLESTYEVCLEYELLKMNYKVDRQKELPVVYNTIKISWIDCTDLQSTTTYIFKTCKQENRFTN